jgi:undecaprenyl-diphosphatase
VRSYEPNRLRRLRWPVGLALLAVAVGLAGYFLDARTFAWREGMPDLVVRIAWFLGEIGQAGWVLVPAGALTLLVLLADWARVDRWQRAAWGEIGFLSAYLFWSVAGAGILTNILKQVIGRMRPLYVDAEDWLAFDPFGFSAANASFPSGHATTAGAVLVVASLVLPRWRWLFLLAAVAMAASRIVVGAHFPSDVIAGLAVGAAFAWASALFLALGGRGFSFGPHGALRAPTRAIRRLLRQLSGAHRLLRAFVIALFRRPASP